MDTTNIHITNYSSTSRFSYWEQFDIIFWLHSKYYKWILKYIKNYRRFLLNRAYLWLYLIGNRAWKHSIYNPLFNIERLIHQIKTGISDCNQIEITFKLIQIGDLLWGRHGHQTGFLPRGRLVLLLLRRQALKRPHKHSVFEFLKYFYSWFIYFWRPFCLFHHTGCASVKQFAGDGGKTKITHYNYRNKSN